MRAALHRKAGDDVEIVTNAFYKAVLTLFNIRPFHIMLLTVGVGTVMLFSILSIWSAIGRRRGGFFE